jgi:hypothetical protein
LDRDDSDKDDVDAILILDANLPEDYYGFQGNHCWFVVEYSKQTHHY